MSVTFTSVRSAEVNPSGGTRVVVVVVGTVVVVVVVVVVVDVVVEVVVDMLDVVVAATVVVETSITVSSDAHAVTTRINANKDRFTSLKLLPVASKSKYAVRSTKYPYPVAKKITAPEIKARKGGPKITMVTAYDYPGAVIADRAGVDIILVGDSVANVVHGMPTTLEIGIDEIVLHTRAVKRANPNALVVADMPWLSFHISAEDSVRNAGRLVREGGAEAVKLEGGRKRLPVLQAILDAEIPVMGHIGLTPQSVHAMGGFKVQGKAVDAATEMIEDARALSEAGCFSIVLEGVPDILGEIITKEVDVPTIGIGAGPSTDGQVLVFHDVLGLGSGSYPKFVRPYADLADQAVAALERFKADVESGNFPSDAESYHVPDEIAAELLKGIQDVSPHPLPAPGGNPP